MSRAQEQFWIKSCALSAMSTGSRALPLLCKTTRFLPADVTRLVRECLRVHVGARCPAWIDDLLWNQVRALPWGTYRRITVTFCVSGNIDYGIYRQDETSWGRTSLRPCHMPTRSGLSSSDEHETDDTPVRVEVLMVVDDHICRWLLRCLQGDTELRVCGNPCFMLSVTELLSPRFAAALTVVAQGQADPWRCRPPGRSGAPSLASGSSGRRRLSRRRLRSGCATAPRATPVSSATTAGRQARPA